MNKFRLTENDFLPRLIKQESYRSSHCIFQSVYALNTRSIKTLRRIIVKVLITLLIKQQFYVPYWLATNKCLKSAIELNIWQMFLDIIIKVATRAR